MGKIFVKVPVWNIESETGYKPMTTFGKTSLLQMPLVSQPLKTLSNVPLMSGKVTISILQSLLWYLTTRLHNGMRETCLLQNSITMRGTLPITMRSTTCKVTS